MDKWRFTNVKAGDKIPYPDNWQNTPLTLEQVSSPNIGLILGVPSGGVMAIDFDGETAWKWFDENIGCVLPPTTAWSSGKPYRCQMAFQVPPEAWELVRTRKIVTKRPSAPGAGDGEGFEFRWTGGQSVLPPSKLRDGRCYYWVETNPVAEIPIEILERWVIECEQMAPISDKPYVPVTIDQLTEDDFENVKEILERLKSHCDVLDYDTWFKVTAATANALGDFVAEELLKSIWAENHRGEYRHKIRSRNPNKSGGVGTLVHLVRTYEPQFRQKKIEDPITALKKKLMKYY